MWRKVRKMCGKVGWGVVKTFAYSNPYYVSYEYREHTETEYRKSI